MIQFTKLRISGFKSFVERTELDIGPGLNGIVGPNGCGKSNLVEALRWVMGENSAKRMRGAGMEDVIFAGTDKRSARNFAEVALLLDNTTRKAPSTYNNSNEIEVTRRIERDRGSSYKINNKNARARDVQMLFADTVTGANSPSIVSQGDVTRMINAKPHDRRLILEESAGIAGLYARRHEAEIRLKAADTNLARLEDITGSMESRLTSLKRQSAQAAKYKNLSAQIRQQELVITYLEWQTLLQKQKENKAIFAAAESIVGEKMLTVTQLSKTQNTQIEDMPALRKEESEIAASLQKYKIDIQRREEEITRHKNALQDLKNQLHQVTMDFQHEEQTLEEATQMLSRVEEEHQSLIEDQGTGEAEYEEKQTAQKILKEKLEQLEHNYTTLKENAATKAAQQDALKRQIKRHEEQLETLKTRLKNTQEKSDSLSIETGAKEEIQRLENQAAKLEQNIQGTRKEQENTQAKITAEEQHTEEARTKLSAIEKEYAQICAEIKTLQTLFDSDNGESNFENVLTQIETHPGFEIALARALGDSLSASLDSNAPASWKAINTKSAHPLPSNIPALSQYVQAPQELHLALSQIGIVENFQAGDNAKNQLTPGQSLVSKDGIYWRWDGYHVQQHAADRNAIYLEQKSKLLALKKTELDIQSALTKHKELFTNAAQTLKSAKDQRDLLAADTKEKEQKLKEIRPALQKIKERSMRIEAEQKSASDQIITLLEDIKTTQATRDKDQDSLKALSLDEQDTTKRNQDIEQLKQQLEQTKEQFQHAVRTFDQLTQAQSTRSARMQALADERISQKNRAIRSRERIRQIQSRQKELTEKLEILEKNPIVQSASSEDTLTTIAALEQKHKQAIERLNSCERDIEATRKALKQAEDILGQEREKRAGANAMLAAINEQLSAMEQTILERLEIRPQDIPQHAAIDLVQYQTGDLPKLKEEKEKLARARESIGPVNLRAEDEALALEKELTTLLHERADLMQAIDELRGGISKINKEARQRLLIAFEQVDSHFQKLFERLFRGGKAHLKLIDSEDPLGAGLEIFAQPPGKALQSLSLLSGGEQTLASIALIFAMFLTNPSPICVLDEIDAPLDDSNVDRVCDLLDEISSRGETRFLIITHHRISMARMHRLYGVTMSEKGVSQLVSVDLQSSFEFIDKQVA